VNRAAISEPLTARLDRLSPAGLAALLEYAGQVD
jgi:hypothetical protein